MIKHSFSPNDAMNSHLLDFITRTAEAFRMNGDAGIYAGIQPLIIEDAGTWTKWRDYSDEAGYYVTYRCAPLDAEKPEVQAHAAGAEDRWNGIFPRVIASWREVEVSDSPTSRRTLYVHTSTYQIGD